MPLPLLYRILLFSLLLGTVATLAAGARATTTDATTCTEDLWDCENWTPCAANGTRARLCVLDVDCPDVESPLPIVIESCARPLPSPTKPAPTPRPTPTPSPTPLGCDLPEQDERIRCQLQATATPAILSYLPEECHAIEDSAAREQCFVLYREAQQCPTVPARNQRIACLKKIIGLEDLAVATAACEQLPENERADCRITLRSRVYTLIKFRFDELEQRAKDLPQRGAPLEMIVPFILSIEDAKQKFNLATTKDERRAVILEVRKLWQEFARTVSPALQ